MGSASKSAKKNLGIGSVLGLPPEIAGAQAGAQAGVHAISPTPPDVPDVPAPTVMPVPGQDELANIIARRRSIQAQLARRGRLSTILSQPNTEPLGGTS